MESLSPVAVTMHYPSESAEFFEENVNFLGYTERYTWRYGYEKTAHDGLKA
jgi:hypothetical protein